MGYQGQIAGPTYGGYYLGAGVRRFDTGLQVPLRAAIRAAVIDRLGTTPTGNGKPLPRAAGGYVVKIAALPRPLRGDSDEDLAFLAIALQGASPALAVALGRMELSPDGGGDNDAYRGELEVAVYAVSRNFRSLVDGRLSPDVVAAGDPAADPGVEAMLEHAREVLCGPRLAVPGAGPLRARTEDELVTDAEGSVWEQRYAVSVQIDLRPDRAATEVADRIEVLHVADGMSITTHSQFEGP